MRVLLVDDSPELRECLRAALDIAGHQVLEVGTVAAARDAFAHLKPDVALIDGNLPEHFAGGRTGPYGPFLLLEARAWGIKAILFSCDDSLLADGRQAGFPVLAKGASITEVLAALESCVGVREDRSAG